MLKWITFLVSILFCYCPLPWVCLATVQNTGQMGDYFTPVRFSSGCNIQCMSTDGRSCIWSFHQQCLSNINNTAVDSIVPLECGPIHLSYYGVTGYDSVGHWCWTGMQMFTPQPHEIPKPPCEVGIPEEYANARLQGNCRNFICPSDRPSLTNVTCGTSNCTTDECCQKLVIYSAPSSPSPSPSTQSTVPLIPTISPAQEPRSSGISGGATAGIVVGSVLGGGLVVIAAGAAIYILVTKATITSGVTGNIMTTQKQFNPNREKIELQAYNCQYNSNLYDEDEGNCDRSARVHCDICGYLCEDHSNFLHPYYMVGHNIQNIELWRQGLAIAGANAFAQAQGVLSGGLSNFIPFGGDGGQMTNYALNFYSGYQDFEQLNQANNIAQSSFLPYNAFDNTPVNTPVTIYY